MKNRDSKLDRLFQAARSAPASEAPDEMPAHLQTRILAHWLKPDETPEWLLWLPALLRNALVCAGLAMLLCVAWHQFGAPPADPYGVPSEFIAEESILALRDELIP